MIPYIVGFTDQQTVKLDLDKKGIKDATWITHLLMERYNLEGYIILESSPNNHLAIFNEPVSWEDNTHIMGFAGWLIKTHDYDRWLTMQLIKRTSTVRVSPKGDKPAPTIVYEYGEADKMIAKYKQFCTLMLSLVSE